MNFACKREAMDTTEKAVRKKNIGKKKAKMSAAVCAVRGGYTRSSMLATKPTIANVEKIILAAR